MSSGGFHGEGDDPRFPWRQWLNTPSYQGSAFSPIQYGGSPSVEELPPPERSIVYISSDETSEPFEDSSQAMSDDRSRHSVSRERLNIGSGRYPPGPRTRQTARKRVGRLPSHQLAPRDEVHHTPEVGRTSMSTRGYREYEIGGTSRPAPGYHAYEPGRTSVHMERRHTFEVGESSRPARGHSFHYADASGAAAIVREAIRQGGTSHPVPDHMMTRRQEDTIMEDRVLDQVRYDRLLHMIEREREERHSSDEMIRQELQLLKTKKSFTSTVRDWFRRKP